MNDADPYRALIRDLSRGERVTRHDHPALPAWMFERLDRIGLIKRDAEGYWIRGPEFDLRVTVETISVVA